MHPMSRTLRTLAVLALVLALVASLPALCPCAARSGSGSGEHGCCSPPTGVRVSDHGCCGVTGEVVDQAGAPPVPEALAPALAVRVPGLAAFSAWLAAPQAALTCPSPPSILRV
jgi:hypothetical protein